MRRIGIFGWGVIAPRSPNVGAFEKNLAGGESWLSPFTGFGPANFLVGEPDFHFADYKSWIDARFPPNRFPQLEKKMGLPTQYAIGAFIQALDQNPGIEQALQALGTRAHVYVGTGLGDLETTAKTTLTLYRAQRRWDRFWAEPSRNAAVRTWLAASPDERATLAPDAPPAPSPELAPDDREAAEDAHWHYWAGRSAELHEYLAELKEIESIGVQGDVESGKMAMIKEKRTRANRLQKKWSSPEPPWNMASANLLWNIHNAGPSQISMLGKIKGASFAPVAACSTFGVALKLAMSSIRLGEADAVVLGATDPPPHALTVGGFYNARVTAADGAVSKPLTQLRGTHVAGGAAVWIIADLDSFTAKGFTPLGMEPIAVGVSSDAEHIITPSKEGPISAMKLALQEAGAQPSDVHSWDMHATATPGDHLEIETLRDVFGEDVLVTARKGIFGHGMGACGGWELTAQYLGHARGEIFPVPFQRSELNAQIAAIHGRYVFDHAEPAPEGLAGKISMGIGGINACVLSRPLPKKA